MAKNYEALSKKVRSRPGADARIAAHKERMLAEIGLFELRQRREFTQTELAKRLGLSQAAISKFENAEDCRLSTLERYVEEMGGHLEINAVFEDGEPTRIGLRRSG